MTLINSKDVLHKVCTQGTVIVRVDTYAHKGKILEQDVWANWETGIIDWSIGDVRVVGAQS